MKIVRTGEGNAGQTAATIARRLAHEQILGLLPGHTAEVSMQIMAALAGKRPFIRIGVGTVGWGNGRCQPLYKFSDIHSGRRLEAND